MKALDIVRTPKGGIAFVTETNDHGESASINYIGDLNIGDEKNAWWDKSELTVIDSIPRMIAMATAHPFGRGKDDVDVFFHIKNNNNFDYQTSCVNQYNYDIFEKGGGVVAYNVEWEYVEKLVDFFNAQYAHDE